MWSPYLDLAYHEAGHALAGHILGARVNYIVFKPEVGDCCASVGGWTPGTDDLICMAAALLAGSLADHIGMNGITIPDWYNSNPITWKGAKDDVPAIKQNFENWYAETTEEQLETLFVAGRDLAWKTLTANLPTLKALATAIDRLGQETRDPRRTMSREEILRIIC